MEGRVKFFNVTKGFGFIVDSETGEDVFVHATGLKPGVTISQEDKVTYSITEGKKGTNAVDVELVK